MTNNDLTELICGEADEVGEERVVEFVGSDWVFQQNLDDAVAEFAGGDLVCLFNDGDDEIVLDDRWDPFEDFLNDDVAVARLGESRDLAADGEDEFCEARGIRDTAECFHQVVCVGVGGEDMAVWGRFGENLETVRVFAIEQESFKFSSWEAFACGNALSGIGEEIEIHFCLFFSFSSE